MILLLKQYDYLIIYNIIVKKIDWEQEFYDEIARQLNLFK